MAQYSIGEVEQLTGIRPYVLRYWEEVIPCFSPRKDINGRRIYSARDIDTINRLKYLIYTKRYTIDGARSQIIQESAVAETQISAVQALHEIRGELGDLYLNIQKNKEKRSLLSLSAEKAEQRANLINIEQTSEIELPVSEDESLESNLTPDSNTNETKDEISQESEIQLNQDYNTINEDNSAPLYL